MTTPIVNLNESAAVSGRGLVLPSVSPARKSARAENRAIQVTACHSWEQLKEWIPDWEAILRENRSLSIFSTPEWLGSWWKAFGFDKRMVTLVLSTEDNECVGLAPLYFDEIESSLFGKIAQLRLIGDGSGDSDNLDLIARPGFEWSCSQALLCWLRQHQDWDVCSLNAVAGSSLVGRGLKHELDRANWPLFSGKCPNSAIQLPGSWSQYVEQLSPSFRPLVTRYPRKLAQRYQVQISRSENHSDLAARLEILFSLHKKRWNLLNQPGSFGSRERREFYFQMAQSFLRKGWLEFWLMELNGVPAAAQYCFRYFDTVYILQEGFDPKFAADKAGYALRAAMLKHFIETGVRRYDFLGGLADHKQHWRAKPGEYLNLQFARPWSIGGLYLSCTNGLAKSKEWLRTTLPASVWNVLHRLRVTLKKNQAGSASA
jgi:CelD/BcsL family acetyltransferase involved in cellulose biosynthesis